MMLAVFRAAEKIYTGAHCRWLLASKDTSPSESVIVGHTFMLDRKTFKMGSVL